MSTPTPDPGPRGGTVKDHADLSQLPRDTYVSFACYGSCRMCGRAEDLRMGACWDCADFAHGRRVAGGHELWDSRNPSNRWFVEESPDA